MTRKLIVVLLSAALCLLWVTSALAVEYKEAPELATRVAAGELPTIEKRLPEEPLVVKTIDKIGKYGGTWRFVTSMPDMSIETICFTFETPMTYDYDCKTIIPGWAKSWEFSEEGKVMTLHMRKGMKWSDGYPVTTEDVQFAYEDVMKNKELTPVFPLDYVIGGEPMKLEVVDGYTFRLRFAKPFLSAPVFLTSAIQQKNLLSPAHYLKKFHIKYADKAKLDEMVEEGDYGDWARMFIRKNWTVALVANINCPADYPVISMYHAAGTPFSGILVYKRNPYYWKVDEEGKQLPYIGEVRDIYVSTPEAKNMKIIDGEVDFVAMWSMSEDTTLYYENEERGDYTVYPWVTTFTTRVPFTLNQTMPQDPVLQKLHRNRFYRIALSLAINREQINEVIFGGAAMPSQETCVYTEGFYEPGWSHAYTEYDPELANLILDSIGLEERDSEEWRLRPDGKRLEYNVLCAEAGPDDEETEIVSRNWAKIGIKMNYKTVTPELQLMRLQANEMQISVGRGWGWGVMSGIISNPPLGLSGFAPIGPLWGRWFDSDGEKGEEPPKKVQELYAKWKTMKELDYESQLEIATELFAFQAKNLFILGTVARTIRPLVVSNRLKNVLKEAVWGMEFTATSVMKPAQVYIEE